MLNDLQWFSMEDSPEKEVLNNYAKLLLNKLGVWRPENIWDIVENLLKIPIKINKKE